MENCHGSVASSRVTYHKDRRHFVLGHTNKAATLKDIEEAGYQRTILPVLGPREPGQSAVVGGDKSCWDELEMIDGDRG
ncbi:hypothetical protein M413DRAFT_448361 [Hebeloma cylindrosporum]|uniref:Uncharacterized protein n=1 Tax=Hebeloma cylindrosporum TaxID=76867 RepID=A0A0C3BLH5_HEBCY|nr:hypothetical protein M413DRAFT_448361 [Hebeloma cylindrosporum h7]